MLIFNNKESTVKNLFNRVLLLISVVLFSLFSQLSVAEQNPDYLLGAGDSIRVNVFQNPDLTIEARVSENGTISYPLIGDIKIGGSSISAAEHKIAAALTKGDFLKNPQVNIVLLLVRGNQVAVLGMVNRPGRYPLETANTHLSEIIATAGGVSSLAGNGVALLSGVRNGQPYKFEADIASLFLDDKKSQDIVVSNGDVVYIVPGNQISILGQVNRPGRFPLEKFKMNLVDALALAGGITSLGSDKVIISGLRDGTPFKKEVDVANMFLSPNKTEDTYVMGGDQIYVHRFPVFYIYGEAQRPTSYRIERNMTVVQALAQGGGPTVRGTERSIKIYRRNDNGVVEKISPKLTDFIQQDDVLYVQESLF